MESKDIATEHFVTVYLDKKKPTYTTGIYSSQSSQLAIQPLLPALGGTAYTGEIKKLCMITHRFINLTISLNVNVCYT